MNLLYESRAKTIPSNYQVVGFYSENPSGLSEEAWAKHRRELATKEHLETPVVGSKVDPQMLFWDTLLRMLT